METRAIVYQYDGELKSGSDAEKAVKQHRIGNANTLNIYLVPRTRQGALGYA